MNDLAGQHALITGASRGLGARIARAYWEAGADLLLVARSAERLAEIAHGLPLRPAQRVVTIAADLAHPAAAEAIVAQSRAAFGGLDVLVNNAAIQGPIGPAWENDWAQWQKTLQVNLLSPVALCRLCVPWMAQQGRGVVINLSGGGATAPRPRFSAYAAAKCALVRFSETLAEEVRGLGIAVNCVAPGAMESALLEEIVRAGPQVAGQREYEAALRAKQADAATVERAAALCLWLASPASDGLTGKLLSAVWDPWEELPQHLHDLQTSDVYTLGRIVPRDRGLPWGER